MRSRKKKRVGRKKRRTKYNHAIAQQQLHSGFPFLKLPKELRNMIYFYLIPNSDIFIFSRWNRRHLEILATNRQIYAEALQFMYQQTELILTDKDISCTFHDPEIYCCQTWRHNPLLGIGTSLNNTQHYTLPSQRGQLEPHIVAQFQRLAIDITLNLPLERMGVPLTPAHTRELIYHLESLTLFQILVQILANSPKLKTLKLLITVICSSDFYPAIDGEEGEETRVGNIIVQSGVFNILSRLENVEKLTFEFTDSLLAEIWDMPVDPRTETSVKILEDLKAAVESNSKALRPSELETQFEG